MPAPAASPSSETAWIITPDAREGFLARTREVWRYRRILLFFAIKAIQQLYSNTRLGPAWILIRTLVPLFVGSFVFGSVMGIPSGGVPYFVFFLAGQIAWNCFDGPLIRASRGLEVNRQLLTKIYVPRVILPLGHISAGLLEPMIIAAVFVAAVVHYHGKDGVWYVQPDVRLLASAASILLIVGFAFSLSLWTSIWQARARDTRFALRYALGFWLYLTPVIYPMSVVPAEARWAMYLNPLTASVETFRWGVLPNQSHSWVWFGYSAAFVLVVFGGGLWHFARTENVTMDKI